MSFRDEDELRREFDRLRSMITRPIQPFGPFPPPFFGMNPVFPDPYPGIFTGPQQPPVPAPTYDEVEVDPEEEVVRRVMEESRKAEEERERKYDEERKRRETEEQMNLDYLAQEDEDMLQESLLASLREAAASKQQPTPVSPALERMEEEERYMDDEDEELKRALEYSMEQRKIEEKRHMLEEAARKREEQQKREVEEKRQREMAQYSQNSGVPGAEDEDAELMQAIAASLEAEREAKKQRVEEKRREDAAMLEERIRRLMGSSMNDVFETKETDMPYVETEEERREKARRQAEIDERQLLRDQQDEEYRASLERDKFLENERRQKEAKDAREKREKERKEAEAKRRREELERRKQARIDEMRRKRETLPEEPREKDPNATSLGCRLPTGARANRRFLKGASLAVVKDWVDSVLVEEILAAGKQKKKEEEEGKDSDNDTLSSSSPLEGKQQQEGEGGEEEEEEEEGDIRELYGYDLVTDFPRKIFNDLSMTLEQAGLVPRALISVAMH